MIDFLIKLYKSIDFNRRYKWPIPSGCPIKIPSEVRSNFEKNKYLKLNLKDKFIQTNNLSAHYWIIKNWGGIKSFKKSESNDIKIREFYKELRQKKLSNKSFSTISSLSKISSFYDCHNYFIYDARAIFSLNWIIFKFISPKKFRLFPQPIGRNFTINKHDLPTIINLSNENFSYFNKNKAYFNYCSLIKKLGAIVCPNEEAFTIEMMLFIASEKEIVEDIQENVRININRSSKNNTEDLNPINNKLIENKPTALIGSNQLTDNSNEALPNGLTNGGLTPEDKDEDRETKKKGSLNKWIYVVLFFVFWCVLRWLMRQWN